MATKLEINRKAAEEKGYIALAHQVEQANGIPNGILVGLLEQESAWRPDVISGKKKSRAGAIGIAQFMPATADDEGVDPLDPEAAIRASGKYLAKMKQSAGSWTGALTSYNWGIGNYRKWVSGKKKRQPKEAREYANKVQARAARFRNPSASSSGGDTTGPSAAISGAAQYPAAQPDASAGDIDASLPPQTQVTPSPEIAQAPDAALIPMPDEPTADPMEQSLLPNTTAAPSPGMAATEQALIPEEPLPSSAPLIAPPEASMLPQRELPQRGQRAKSILKQPKQIEVTVDTPAGPRQVLAENPEEEKLIQDLAHSGETQLLTLMPELIQTRDLTRSAPLIKNKGDSVDTLLRQIIRGVK